MQVSSSGQVLGKDGRAISRLGTSSWCLVLHENEVQILLPGTEPPRQQPEFVVIPKRADSLFTMLADTVQSELELCFALRGLPVSTTVISELCAALDLSSLLNTNPMDLSGGQKAKLAVALALLVNPKVLVIDNTLEPIDREARIQVIHVLRNAVISGLRIIELATSSPERNEHIDEAVTVDSTGGSWVDSSRRKGTEFWGYTNFTGIPDAPEISAKPVLSLDALTFQYDAGFGIASISINVHAGEIIWLAGPNGAGKTTILKCLALLLSPQAGSMCLIGSHSAITMTFPVGKRRMKIHEYLLYQFQEPDDQIYCATVREELLATVRQVREEADAQLEGLVKILEFQSHLDESPWNLRRSSRRLLTLGSVLCANPRIALLDEPTAELDASEKRRVAWALREYVRSGGACIVVSHDHTFMRNMASRIIYVRDGSVIDHISDVQDLG